MRSIMAMTGHKTTQMVRRYIREANIFKNNALNKVKYKINLVNLCEQKLNQHVSRFTK